MAKQCKATTLEAWLQGLHLGPVLEKLGTKTQHELYMPKALRGRRRNPLLYLYKNGEVKFPDGKIVWKL